MIKSLNLAIYITSATIILLSFGGCAGDKPSPVSKTVPPKTASTSKTNVSTDAETHYNRGLVYQQQGKLDEAIREFKEAVRLKPNYAQAYNNTGTSYQTIVE